MQVNDKWKLYIICTLAQRIEEECLSTSIISKIEQDKTKGSDPLFDIDNEVMIEDEQTV